MGRRHSPAYPAHRSAPVIAGIAAANHVDESPSWPAMIGALVVALALVAG